MFEEYGHAQTMRHCVIENPRRFGPVSFRPGLFQPGSFAFFPTVATPSLTLRYCFAEGNTLPNVKPVRGSLVQFGNNWGGSFRHW